MRAETLTKEQVDKAKREWDPVHQWGPDFAEERRIPHPRQRRERKSGGKAMRSLDLVVGRNG